MAVVSFIIVVLLAAAIDGVLLAVKICDRCGRK